MYANNLGEITSLGSQQTYSMAQNVWDASGVLFLDDIVSYPVNQMFSSSWVGGSLLTYIDRKLSSAMRRCHPGESLQKPKQKSIYFGREFASVVEVRFLGKSSGYWEELETCQKRDQKRRIFLQFSPKFSSRDYGALLKDGPLVWTSLLTLT